MAQSPPGIVADSTAAALCAQLDQVWSAMLDLGRSLSEADWARPTACPGWPVAAQYAHVIGTESMLLGRKAPDAEVADAPHLRNDIAKANERWVAGLAGAGRTDVLDRFTEVTTARRAALGAMDEAAFDAASWTPIGQSTYRRFMQIRVFDCWVHEQDVREAVDRPGGGSGAPAEQSVDEIVRALGYLVGKKAGAPDGAVVTVELTGPVTRTVHVAVSGGRAGAVASSDRPATTTTVRLSSRAFAQLACGRVDPGAVAEGAMGGVTFAGDADLGRRLVANLAFTI